MYNERELNVNHQAIAIKEHVYQMLWRFRKQGAAKLSCAPYDCGVLYDNPANGKQQTLKLYGYTIIGI